MAATELAAWRKKTLTIGRSISATALTLLVLGVVLFVAGLRVDLTNSLPVLLYWRVTPPHVDRMGIAEACLPEAIAVFGRDRGYLPLPGRLGPCPGNVVPVLKVMVGVPGDEVRLAGGSLTIDGRKIEGCGTQHSADSLGNPLPRVRGSWRLAGAVWLCGTSPDSWDSRYYGPVPVSALRGTAVWWLWAQGQGRARLESWLATN